jgi:hypothetical protein
MKERFDIRWLMANHMVAFDSLPECYQADTCLVFFWEDGKLKAEPAIGQEEALGTWVSIYNPKNKVWSK